MELLFSVIVPIYKVEKYLRQCIDSILSQEYDNYELILVDDGSPDNCPQICDEYASMDRKVKVIHKQNGGLVSARKAGCQVASGKYILNVDGDDWVKEGYFAALDRVIRQYNPDVICFGAVFAWNDKSEEYPLTYAEGMYSKNMIQEVINPILIEAENGRYFSPAVWAKAVKKELYVKCQMMVDERISIGEDSACTKPIIYMAENLYIMSNCLYSYRQNEQSMTKNRKAFSLEAPVLIAKEFERVMGESSEMMAQIQRNLVHNLFNAAVSQFNREENLLNIKKEIREALNDNYTKNAIRQCNYSWKYKKGVVAKICLKYELMLLMRIYCKRRS